MTAFFEALLANPAVILTVGAFVIFFLPRHLACAWCLLVTAFSAIKLYTLGLGEYGALHVFGEQLTTVRVDPLSRIFAVVFHIAIVLNVIYAWGQRDKAQNFAMLAYPAACLGGVLAGDLITLFFWWEMAAITSVFLVWAPGTRVTYLAGMRYLAIQILSGVLLLGGVALTYRETGSFAFDMMGLRDADGAVKISALVMFLAFGIKSAFPLLHNWVQDAYPKSTLTGAIILSIFTTKLAVYSLARAFPGTNELIYIGVVMTLFPIFFALIENDLRKVLCYSINNQVGFMVCAIGLGTINGAAGYAFGNIIFEGLLFMALGAAMHRTGTSKATELGGLYKTMPVTMALCIVGALSISAFPGTLGFVTKGLIIDGAGEAHLFWVWLGLLFASAGVLEHAGIKIPYFTFFAHDSGQRPKDAPLPMMIAMGIAAALCLGLGIYPDPLYALLPDQAAIADYHPYTAYHLIEQLQLLLWAVLAFAILILVKWYPAEVPSTNLDTDWFYRVPGRALMSWAAGASRATWIALWGIFSGRVQALMARVYSVHGPEGEMARSWPIGFMALWTAILLALVLVISFIA
ncbi:Na(+)/H(+) antiporter subunit D [Hyphococcus luteus]|uniref:Na(+)/H(+) antiporter subunit D n=1 Tax=Hyphococcus luteus TaxID=2058213 RepID=A0A2S7JZY1_9PROT|nr:Na(+)/H(+) antiporter subunit D [Marinicaulis flavus]PQA85819.1 Na(+)/H(+) antiporter subunit D [Marinicaulis flavus]